MVTILNSLIRGCRLGINPIRPWLSLAGGRGAFVASAGLHAAAGLLLAALVISHSGDLPSAEVDLSLTDEQPSQTLEHLPLTSVGESANPSGSRSGMPLPPETVPVVMEPAASLALTDSNVHSALELDPGLPSAQELAQTILGAKIARALGRGLGTGIGDGIGDGIGAGQGESLFHSSGNATRFVYVLDCSGSMQERDSQARNRFERLKIELVRSIGGLPESHEFFVIFFNSVAVPMPARTLQRASLQNKRKYLEWVVKVQGGGDTDPHDAIAHAFRLKPDLIYLLTDGSFSDKALDAIARENTRGVAIHTFCLGDAKGESLLRRIAETNHGVYTFVP
ncbi:MAG: VWA domain-containing protein [Planctomycetaceae bacterium]|nr:VWA domain-containing protein [Planctomycetaceae bacterium]